MYKKFPAANWIIKSVKPCIFPTKTIPITAPNNAVTADNKLNIKAFFFVNPEYNKTPKSAISWGISWNITDIVAAIEKTIIEIDVLSGRLK